MPMSIRDVINFFNRNSEPRAARSLEAPAVHSDGATTAVAGAGGGDGLGGRLTDQHTAPPSAAVHGAGAGRSRILSLDADQLSSAFDGQRSGLLMPSQLAEMSAAASRRTEPPPPQPSPPLPPPPPQWNGLTKKAFSWSRFSDEDRRLVLGTPVRGRRRNSTSALDTRANRKHYEAAYKTFQQLASQRSAACAGQEKRGSGPPPPDLLPIWPNGEVAAAASARGGPLQRASSADDMPQLDTAQLQPTLQLHVMRSQPGPTRSRLATPVAAGGAAPRARTLSDFSSPDQVFTSVSAPDIRRGRMSASPSHWACRPPQNSGSPLMRRPSSEPHSLLSRAQHIVYPSVGDRPWRRRTAHTNDAAPKEPRQKRPDCRFESTFDPPQIRIPSPVTPSYNFTAQNNFQSGSRDVHPICTTSNENMACAHFIAKPETSTTQPLQAELHTSTPSEHIMSPTNSPEGPLASEKSTTTTTAPSDPKDITKTTSTVSSQAEMHNRYPPIASQSSSENDTYEDASPKPLTISEGCNEPSTTDPDIKYPVFGNDIEIPLERVRDAASSDDDDTDQGESDVNKQDEPQPSTAASEMRPPPPPRRRVLVERHDGEMHLRLSRSSEEMIKQLKQVEYTPGQTDEDGVELKKKKPKSFRRKLKEVLRRAKEDEALLQDFTEYLVVVRPDKMILRRVGDVAKEQEALKTNRPTYRHYRNSGVAGWTHRPQNHGSERITGKIAPSSTASLPRPVAAYSRDPPSGTHWQKEIPYSPRYQQNPSPTTPREHSQDTTHITNIACSDRPRLTARRRFQPASVIQESASGTTAISKPPTNSTASSNVQRKTASPAQSPDSTQATDRPANANYDVSRYVENITPDPPAEHSSQVKANETSTKIDGNLKTAGPLDVTVQQNDVKVSVISKRDSPGKRATSGSNCSETTASPTKTPEKVPIYTRYDCGAHSSHSSQLGCSSQYHLPRSETEPATGQHLLDRRAPKRVSNATIIAETLPLKKRRLEADPQQPRDVTDVSNMEFRAANGQRLQVSVVSGYEFLYQPPVNEQVITRIHNPSYDSSGQHSRATEPQSTNRSCGAREQPAASHPHVAHAHTTVAPYDTRGYRIPYQRIQPGEPQSHIRQGGTAFHSFNTRYPTGAHPISRHQGAFNALNSHSGPGSHAAYQTHQYSHLNTGLSKDAPSASNHSRQAESVRAGFSGLTADPQQEAPQRHLGNMEPQVHAFFQAYERSLSDRPDASKPSQPSTGTDSDRTSAGASTGVVTGVDRDRRACVRAGEVAAAKRTSQQQQAEWQWYIQKQQQCQQAPSRQVIGRPPEPNAHHNHQLQQQGLQMRHQYPYPAGPRPKLHAHQPDAHYEQYQYAMAAQQQRQQQLRHHQPQPAQFQPRLPPPAGWSHQLLESGWPARRGGESTAAQLPSCRLQTPASTAPVAGAAPPQQRRPAATATAAAGVWYPHGEYTDHQRHVYPSLREPWAPVAPSMWPHYGGLM